MADLYFNFTRRDPWRVVRTAAELDASLDELQAESKSTGWPTVAKVGLADRERIPRMEIGVSGEAGFVSYGSAEPLIEVISKGTDADGGDEVTYIFQGDHPYEFPRSAEIPFEEVRRAVHFYMANDAAQPIDIEWQEYDG